MTQVFLLSFYGNDAHSSLALEYTNSNPPSILLTQFNYFEFCSALHLSEFRRRLPKNEVTLFMTSLKKDLSEKFFLETRCNLEIVLEEAEKLSSYYTTKNGYRAFDLIHVAGALHLDAKIFLTFDKQQKSLAKNLGLEIPF